MSYLELFSSHLKLLSAPQWLPVEAAGLREAAPGPSSSRPFSLNNKTHPSAASFYPTIPYVLYDQGGKEVKTRQQAFYFGTNPIC